VITLTSDKASKQIQVRCDELRREQGQWLADTVAEFDGRERGLADGVTLEIGWTVFFLRGQPDGSLLVCEPDYQSDPFKTVRADVTASLTVLVAQIDLLRAIGVTPAACRFDQKIILKKGVLDEARIFARRQQSTQEDSGWYIGPAGGAAVTPKAEDLEAIPLYELMNRRAHILFALALPTDYMVVWNGTAIEALMDPQGRNLWHTT
jgi:hypothetical protein